MRRVVLLVGACLPVCLWAVVPLISRAAGPEVRAGSLPGRIAAHERRIAAKRARERVLTTTVAAYNRRVRMLQLRADSLGGRLRPLLSRLDAEGRRLDTTQRRLRFQRARAQRLRRRLAATRRVLAARLVALYESDRPDVVTVVLNSDGFADLLDRAAFVRRIARSDRRIIGTVRRAKRQAAAATMRLTTLQAGERRTIAALDARRDAIARIRDIVVANRAAQARVRDARRATLASVRVSRRRLESEVRVLQRRQAAIARALNGAQARKPLPARPLPPVAGGGGAMIWPVSGPITSPFCERRSYEACHPGLDIGVPEGTPIRAAATGRVVLLQPTAQSGGYGNYTCVQHTATLSSCYAHQQRFGTTLGEQVRQGQVIGYVGNTGHSFGAHLHFEVRVAGAITNPLNYL